MKKSYIHKPSENNSKTQKEIKMPPVLTLEKLNLQHHAFQTSSIFKNKCRNYIRRLKVSIQFQKTHGFCLAIENSNYLSHVRKEHHCFCFCF